MIDTIMRSDFKAVDEHEPMSRVAGFLRGETRDTPIVTRDGQILGLLNVENVMKSTLPPNEHVGRHVLNTPSASPDATIDETAALFLRTGAESLPVAERGRPVGILGAVDVARALGVRGVRARDALATLPMLREDQTAGEALRAFRGVQESRLPVIDASGRITGFLARANVVRLETAYRRSDQHDATRDRSIAHPLTIPVGEIMDRGWPSVDADAGMDAIADLAAEWGLAPVTNGARECVGVVTPRSLLATAAARVGAEGPEKR